MKGEKFKKLAEEYLALRSEIIRSIKIESALIRHFAKFMAHQDRTIITREVVWNYLTEIKGNSPISKYKKVNTLRMFCRHLHQIDERHYIPEKCFFRKPRSNFKPYIFTENEVLSMMTYARNKLYQGPPRLIVPFIYETLIGLLWATGMRITEAVNLNMADVDLERGIIYVRKTKFYKSRLIPVTPSTVSALREFLKERNSFKYPTGLMAPFFFNWRMRGVKKGRYTADAFHEKIHQIILALRIKGVTRRWARPYDLRHSFATHQLSLVRGDKEAVRRMPLVAVYMGHAKLTYTQTYLHPSVKTLAGFSKGFLEYFEGEAS